MNEKPTLRQRLISPRPAQGEPPVQSVVELAADRVRLSGKVILLIVLFVCLFWFDNVFIFIDSGQAGVRWQRLGGGTEHHTYGEGIHVIWPWDKMFIYEARLQSLSIESTIYAQDGLEIRVKANVRFHPNYKKLSTLHQDVGPEWVTRLVEPEIHSTLRKVLGNFTPNSIYAKDEQGLLDELQTTMAKDFNSEYVVLDKFLLQELKLPDDIQAAIQDKLEEEQRVQAYYFILDKEEYEHKRRIIEATGIRDFEEISGIPILRWRGLDVTQALATSENSKVVIVGTGSDQLPLILNTDESPKKGKTQLVSTAAPAAEESTAETPQESAAE
jgi:regulator of protease activity HflC (stomatin/prohibitin superfamily)